MTPHPQLLGSLAQDPDLKTKLTNFLHTKTDTNVAASSMELIARETDIKNVAVAMSTTPGQRLYLRFLYFAWFNVHLVLQTWIHDSFELIALYRLEELVVMLLCYHSLTQVGFTRCSKGDRIPPQTP